MLTRAVFDFSSHEDLGYRIQPATLLKVSLLHGCFSRFLNCANGARLHKASHFNVTESKSLNQIEFHIDSFVLSLYITGNC